MSLALGLINFNFPISKKWQQTSVFWLKFKATWSISALLKPINPAVSPAKLFLVVCPHARAHPPSAREQFLWGTPGWQNFPTKALQFTSLLQATQTAGEKNRCATKIFLPAGRQVAERFKSSGLTNNFVFPQVFYAFRGSLR